MSQTVNLNERRQERSVTQVRVIQKVGVLVGGSWVWTEFELNATQAQAVTGTGSSNVSAASSLPKPLVQPQKMAQPMTMGRDPAKHLITIGKKFRGMTIEQAANDYDEHELYGYWEWIDGLEEPGPALEVTKEMIEAYLLERQYDPKTRPAKNKTPRRNNNG